MPPNFDPYNLMGNWQARNQERQKQAGALQTATRAGKLKDLLQKTAHQQKMAEGKQTGQFNLENTFAGHGLAGQNAAEVLGIPMSSATDNVPNALRALRDSGNLQRIGAGAGSLAEQTGQYIDDPVGMLKGLGSTFTADTPGSIVRATKMGPVQAAAEDTEKRTFMDLPGGGRVWGMMGQSTQKRSAKGKATTPGKAAQDVRKTLDLLRTKGTVTSYTEGISRKTGKPLFRVVYSDGTTADLDDRGKLTK